MMMMMMIIIIKTVTKQFDICGRAIDLLFPFW